MSMMMMMMMMIVGGGGGGSQMFIDECMIDHKFYHSI
jgi:hypothetical protein